MPVGTVQKLPHSGSASKVALIVVIAFLLVLGGGAYYYLSTKKAAQKAAEVVVKKDIPHITIAGGDRGFDLFYPGVDDSANFITTNRQVFEGLVRYEDNSKIVPLLATSWTNPDTTTWVFTLKDGVKFHTGRVMTAEDVKASLEAAKDSIYGQNFNSTIKTVAVVAPNKVEIKTEGPDPILLNRLTNLWIFDTKSSKPNDSINGTGAYTVKPGTTPTNDKLELVAFDGYHGGHVYTRAVTFIYIENDKLAEAFNAGQINILTQSVDSTTAGLTRANKVVNVEQLSVFHLILNTQRAGSPLANLKVRQAILTGTDPVALTKVREVQGVPIGQMIPPTVPGYNPSVKRPATDVAKAKAMLAEAGYPNGFSLTFTYYGPSKSTADELARQFKDLGITLKLDPQTVIKDLGAKVFGGNTDMAFNTVSSDLFDGTDVLTNYLDSANYSNPRATQLLKQASQTLDQTARLKLIQEVAKISVDDVVDIPMYATAPVAMYYDSRFVLEQDIPGGTSLGTYLYKVHTTAAPATK